MQDSSLATMRRFVEAYLGPLRSRSIEMVDVGAQSVDAHASYRPVFTAPAWRCRGLDMLAGSNVDSFAADPYDWRELPEASVDVVVSGQALEHIEFPWRTLQQIERVLRPGGLACLIAPSAGPEHRYPTGRWRIYPDDMAALAQAGGLNVVELFTDWGVVPWQDSLAILQKPCQPGVEGVLPPQPDRRSAYGAYRAALASRPRARVLRDAFTSAAGRW